MKVYVDNHSRWKLIVPLPAIIMYWGEKQGEFVLGVGWLFFSCEITFLFEEN